MADRGKADTCGLKSRARGIGIHQMSPGYLPSKSSVCFSSVIENTHTHIPPHRLIPKDFSVPLRLLCFCPPRRSLLQLCVLLYHLLLFNPGFLHAFSWCSYPTLEAGSCWSGCLEHNDCFATRHGMNSCSERVNGSRVYLFPVVAVTDWHKQHNLIILQFWRSEVQIWSH